MSQGGCHGFGTQLACFVLLRSSFLGSCCFNSGCFLRNAFNLFLIDQIDVKCEYLILSISRLFSIHEVTEGELGSLQSLGSRWLGGAVVVLLATPGLGLVVRVRRSRLLPGELFSGAALVQCRLGHRASAIPVLRLPRLLARFELLLSGILLLATREHPLLQQVLFGRGRLLFRIFVGGLALISVNFKFLIARFAV